MTVDFHALFCTRIPRLEKKILKAFSSKASSGFRTAWVDFEDVIIRLLIGELSAPPFRIANNCLIPAKHKSSYPDLLVLFNNDQIAFDVKSGEDTKDPWYDIGRLDTYEIKKLQKYKYEYAVTVKWRGQMTPEPMAVYLELAFQSVGIKPDIKGVKYRPYDGKLRPKSWSDFEKRKTHWKTKTAFIRALNISKSHRRNSYIREWIKELTREERYVLLKELCRQK